MFRKSVLLRDPHLLFMVLLRFVPVQIVCDVGAADGRHTEKFALARRRSRIIAFEADPNTFTLLKQREILQQPRIELVNAAVSSRSGVAPFNIIGDKDTGHWRAGGSSLLLRSEKGLRVAREIRQDTVKAVTLGEFLGSPPNNHGRIAVWIDVEGASYEVVRGMAAVASRVAFLQLEVEEVPYWEGEKLKPEIVEELANLGFVEVGHGPGLQHDAVFVNTAHLGLLSAIKIRVLLIAASIGGWLAAACRKALRLLKNYVATPARQRGE